MLLPESQTPAKAYHTAAANPQGFENTEACP